MAWTLVLVSTLVTTTYVTAQSLCNSTIDKANASGIFEFAVDYPSEQGPTDPEGNVPNPYWALTVEGTDNNTKRSLWYNTAGQNYSEDLQNSYDVCAVLMRGLPLNTIELGQDDPGDCSSMISHDCKDAIFTRAAQSAMMFSRYASPQPNSNLTMGALPRVCSKIAGDLGDDGFTFPKECAKEFGYDYSGANPSNSDVSTTAVALTGLHTSGLNEDCPLQADGKTFYQVESEMSSVSHAYDNVTRDVTPILTIFMPVANIDRTSSPGWAQPKLTCVRVKNFSEGSRVSPELPAGTQYTYGHPLSGGAIAGIVVGVVLFVAVASCLTVWWFLRQRKRKLEDRLIESGNKTGENFSNNAAIEPTSRRM